MKMKKLLFHFLELFIYLKILINLKNIIINLKVRFIFLILKVKYLLNNYELIINKIIKLIFLFKYYHIINILILNLYINS